MKIIHCADLHLDSKLQTHLTPEKARERRKELLLTFEKMVDYAKRNEVEAILIAGDMFDSVRATQKTKESVLNLIQENPEIKFFYLTGNHDEEPLIQNENYVIQNLYTFNEEWTTYGLGNVAITGVKLNSKIKTIYDAINLDKDKFNIVVLHGQISKYSSDKNAEIINLQKLSNKNIDYLALGHIHSFEMGDLDTRGKWAYSGCLEGRGFDECGLKGFVMLDINEKSFECNFIPFASRCCHELQVDVTGIINWFDVEREALAKVQNISPKDIVRIVLIGKYNVDLNKYIEHLEAKLQELFYYASVKDCTTLEIDIKDFENDMSLRGEFIRNVLNSSLNEEEKEAVIIAGLKALGGEELK